MPLTFSAGVNNTSAASKAAAAASKKTTYSIAPVTVVCAGREGRGGGGTSYITALPLFFFLRAHLLVADGNFFRTIFPGLITRWETLIKRFTDARCGCSILKLKPVPNIIISLDICG